MSLLVSGSDITRVLAFEAMIGALESYRKSLPGAVENTLSRELAAVFSSAAEDSVFHARDRARLRRLLRENISMDWNDFQTGVEGELVGAIVNALRHLQMTGNFAEAVAVGDLRSPSNPYAILLGIDMPVYEETGVRQILSDDATGAAKEEALHLLAVLQERLERSRAVFSETIHGREESWMQHSIFFARIEHMLEKAPAVYARAESLIATQKKPAAKPELRP